ncbi:AraC family transcriptional regulator [Kordia sp. YSTF-M3]|uniref:AraC family transcriptional regulator n=1 Tax=Kordia aestuariivivens TaxID=2759037 RepID=A0ABR7QHB6_9FLAO|nr:helix-turn-helix domain-containing protein [Kordia aestuariivivens]MBC8757714.1 AraC family transcriptional regulator [Kordia aestuariivivens]
MKHFYLHRTIIVLIVSFISVISYAQNNVTSFIAKYNKLYLKNPNAAISFCDQLIDSEENDKKAFGYAGKAYVHSLQSDFDLADPLFKKAIAQIELVTQEKTDIKGYIFYFQSLRYLESHELETAIYILNETIRYCASNCSPLLEIKLQAALSRLYSLSNKHFKAIEINHVCLSKIKTAPNYLTDYSLQKEYLRQLVSLGFKFMSIHIYHLNEKKYESYLDSTQQYAILAKNYAKKQQIPDYNGNIILMNGDINFYKHNYKIAKQYYQEGLKIYQEENRKKRIAQGQFVIAECDYYLKNWTQAEAIFLKQLANDTWSEFQLLDYEAICYFYLFKIYEQRQQPQKALEYANSYAQKIEEYLKTRNASETSISDIVVHEKRKKEIETYVQNYDSQKKQKRIYLYLFLGSILLTGTLIVYFFRVKRRTKRNMSLLHSRIEQLQQDVTKQNKPKTSNPLTDENALILIEKLKRIEKEQWFLKPNYTLATVAKKLNTNSSYLSKTVNNYLNLTFAAYSNRLRIHSITQRLKEQKNLRNYTVEALAKEAGYKSIGAFNTNFKKLLKVSPSQYLKELKRNE